MPQPAPHLPRTFLKDLELYDPMLRVRWNYNTERWQIGRLRNVLIHFKCDGKHYFYATKEPYWFMTVQNPDGSFRPLDRRVIRWLYQMDIQRCGDARAFYRHYWQERDKLTKQRLRDQTNIQEDIIKEYIIPALKKDTDQFCFGTLTKDDCINAVKMLEMKSLASKMKGRVKTPYIELNKKVTEKQEDEILEK